MNRDQTVKNDAAHHSAGPVSESPREPSNTRGRKRITLVELHDENTAGDDQRFDEAADGRNVAGSTAALPMRPLNRPPMAVLCALDDGCTLNGETWRIRNSQFVIGRGQADAVIAHDRDISAQHAEIGCRWQDGCYRWHLTDLESTNGTFIRVSRIVLHSGKQLILGGRRFQYLDVGQPVGSGGVKHADSSLRDTRDYQPSASGMWLQNIARLVEVNGGESPRSYPLGAEGGYIGSDTHRCMVPITDDPFVDPVHARVFRDGQGRCVIEDNRSRNGLWLRIQSVYLSGLSAFQLGEQRFTIKIM